MKITITGSLGNISKPLAEILISNGHEVTVISNNTARIKDIENLGAKAAIGSVSDIKFLTETFKGADAVYTMVPPNHALIDGYKEYIIETGQNYLEAIKASGVKQVVNLSSIGAHLNSGTGPIAGLHEVEQLLNTLDGVAIKHLRAGFFYTNFYLDAVTIKKTGFAGSNYGEKSKMVMVHPRDIAAAAARELQNKLEGKSHIYVVSDVLTITEVVKILGASIDKPELSWVQFSDEEVYAGMVSAGMPQAIAEVYIEMNNAIGSGILFEDFEKHVPETWGNIKFSDFAAEFAAVYASLS